MLENPSPDAYNALSFVVQILNPKTKIAGIINPCLNMTSEISPTPNANVPIVPKKNMHEGPDKKAIIVTLAAICFDYANEAKSDVNVPTVIRETGQIDKADASYITKRSAFVNNA